MGTLKVAQFPSEAPKRGNMRNLGGRMQDFFSSNCSKLLLKTALKVIPFAIFCTFYSYGANGLEIPAKSSWQASYSQTQRDSAKSAIGFYNRGCRNLRDGNYRKAIRDFSKSIRISPDDPDAYCNRGSAYFKLGKYGKALADSKKAVELDSNDASFRFNLAKVYYTLDDYPNAEKECLATLKIDSTRLKVNCMLGNIYSDMEKYDKEKKYTTKEKYEKADKCYSKEMDLNPNDSQTAALLKLVRVIEKLGE